jgi:hypothetical protein
LNLSIEDLEKNAEDLEYLVKMTAMDIKYKYLRMFRQKFEPFRSKDKQEVIYMVLKKHINIDEMEKRGILIQIFQVHDMQA